MRKSLSPQESVSCKGPHTGRSFEVSFYGIEFDASGRSVYIPSEGRVSAGDYFRFRLKTYPGREICGILSVWYGEGEPSGEPDCFDVMTDESFTYDHVEDFCKVDYSRAFENQRDLFHLAFVHHNTIGRGGMTLYNGPKSSGWTIIPCRPAPTMKGHGTDSEAGPGQQDQRYQPYLQISESVAEPYEHAIIALRFYNKAQGSGPLIRRSRGLAEGLT